MTVSDSPSVTFCGGTGFRTGAAFGVADTVIVKLRSLNAPAGSVTRTVTGWSPTPVAVHAIRPPADRPDMRSASSPIFGTRLGKMSPTSRPTMWRISVSLSISLVWH